MPFEPLGNGREDRDRGTDGRFRLGNKAAVGHGSRYASRVAELRGAMLARVTAADVSAVIGAMINAAKGGDVPAAKLLLQWTLGEPLPLDILEELEQLKAKLQGIATDASATRN